MLLALAQMDPTVQGIFFLVAVILFVVAAVVTMHDGYGWLIPLGLAFAFAVFAWNAFAAS